MTGMTPQTARAYWHALVENAARLVEDADKLFPSPRAQALVVLAMEEIGKAIWVHRAFWDAWCDDTDTEPREMPEHGALGRFHIPKLMNAYEFMSDDELRHLLSGESLAEWDAEREASQRQWAQFDNLAKQQALYVDPDGKGGFTVPHHLHRMTLRFDVWQAASTVLWAINDAALRASLINAEGPHLRNEEASMKAVMARYDD